MNTIEKMNDKLFAKENLLIPHSYTLEEAIEQINWDLEKFYEGFEFKIKYSCSLKKIAVVLEKGYFDELEDYAYIGYMFNHIRNLVNEFWHNFDNGTWEFFCYVSYDYEKIPR